MYTSMDDYLLRKRDGNPLVPHHTPRNSACKEQTRRSPDRPAFILAKPSRFSLQQVEKSIYEKAELARRHQLLRSYHALVNGNQFPVSVPFRGETLRRPSHKTDLYEWRQLWRSYEQNLLKNDPMRHSILMAGDFGPGGLGMGVRVPNTREIEAVEKRNKPNLAIEDKSQSETERFPRLTYSSGSIKADSDVVLALSCSSAESALTPRSNHNFEKFSSPCNLTCMPSGNPVDSYLKECHFKRTFQRPHTDQQVALKSSKRNQAEKETESTALVLKSDVKKHMDQVKVMAIEEQMFQNLEQREPVGSSRHCVQSKERAGLSIRKNASHTSTQKPRNVLKSNYSCRNAINLLQSPRYVLTPIQPEPANIVAAEQLQEKTTGSFPVRSENKKQLRRLLTSQQASSSPSGDIKRANSLNNGRPMSRQRERFFKAMQNAKQRLMATAEANKQTQSNRFVMSVEHGRASPRNSWNSSPPRQYPDQCEEGVQVDIGNVWLTQPSLDDLIHVHQTESCPATGQEKLVQKTESPLKG